MRTWCSRVPAKLRFSVMNRLCTGALMLLQDSGDRARGAFRKKMQADVCSTQTCAVLLHLCRPGGSLPAAGGALGRRRQNKSGQLAGLPLANLT